jgi:hypothetical protein
MYEFRPQIIHFGLGCLEKVFEAAARFASGRCW